MTDQSPENVTRKRIRKMIPWTALIITVGFLAAIALRIDDWGRDWTQNTASLEPDAPRPGLRPVELDSNVEAVIDQIRLWTETDAMWDLVSVGPDDETPQTLELTRTTPIMRFVDDIQVTIQKKPPGGVIVSATSQSRAGKGDLGQNPRNLIELTSALRQN